MNLEIHKLTLEWAKGESEIIVDEELRVYVDGQLSGVSFKDGQKPGARLDWTQLLNKALAACGKSEVVVIEPANQGLVATFADSRLVCPSLTDRTARTFIQKLGDMLDVSIRLQEFSEVDVDDGRDDFRSCY